MQLVPGFIKKLVYYLVSIPQAVSAVATNQNSMAVKLSANGFNTASGKRCCNDADLDLLRRDIERVSIPQAVSAVATVIATNCNDSVFVKFQYRKR